MEKERIVVDNKVHFGQPCIAGTRIPVYCVLELVQAGISFQQIIDKYYPDLTIEDVQACVKYATEIVKSEEVHIAESTTDS